MNLNLVKNYFVPESILDIGANIGQFYLESKEIFPSSKFHLIEGNHYCEENLVGLGVDYDIALLSDEEKDVSFYVRKNEIKCTGNSIYREKTPFFADEEIVIHNKKTRKLDDLLSEKFFDLIKIDVQGSEIDIIKGGLKTIERAKGVILEVSLVEYNENSPNKSEVLKFMDEIGFVPVECLGIIGHPLTHEQIQEDLFFIKKDRIALLSVLFDYPEHYTPPFYKNAIKVFNSDDIHIVRMWDVIKDGSYYDKLFYYKIVGLLNYLEKNIYKKYDYVLFMDATDTNFIKTPVELIKTFKKHECSILFGAEYGLWPPTNYTHLYESKEKTTDKFYLNSGTYIGYTEKVIYHLKDIIEKKYQEGIDDQGRWSIQYLLNDDIKVDQTCDIFFSTYLSKKDVLVNDNQYKLNGLSACIIHDNGPHGEETLKLTELL